MNPARKHRATLAAIVLALLLAAVLPTAAAAAHGHGAHTSKCKPAPRRAAKHRARRACAKPHHGGATPMPPASLDPGGGTAASEAPGAATEPPEPAAPPSPSTPAPQGTGASGGGADPVEFDPPQGPTAEAEESAPEQTLMSAAEISAMARLEYGTMHFFSATSPWNEALPAVSSLDPNSAAMAGALASEAEAEWASGTGPSISTHSFSVPIYTVPFNQATVPVKLNSSHTAPGLEAAWKAVPLPPTATPAAGTDGHLVVWQPSRGRLWEFWRAVHGAGGWEASWGGAIANVATDPGVYSSTSWPGANRSWGASASSLSIVGGLITFEDLRRGRIEHALAIGIPEVQAGSYAAPAQRTDGRSLVPTRLPEGAHLRLDPNLNIPALHLPPLTRMIAEAAQRYGIIVRDGAGNITFYGQDPVTTGANPYNGPGGYFNGSYPAKLLSSFPWSHLQLLRMQLSPSS